MYPPRMFASSDLAEAMEIVAAVRFAAIDVVDDASLRDAVFAPFIIAPGGEGEVALEGHLARSNPLLEMLATPRPARLLFNAADGYLSPSVYAEKQRSGRVVPTWNYVACQMTGTLERIDDGENASNNDSDLADVLARQVTDFERLAGSAWSLADAPADFIETLAQSIFPIRFRPSRCTVHKKLSQNRPADRDAIVAWFDALDQPARRLAYWMRRNGR